MKLVRRFVIGAERDRERNQEIQAVWLRKKLIALGPTFIKIGQAMGTRADLLPLPFVTELGTLVDQVPPFPNEVAFARIEHELGKKINEVYSEFELDPVAAASLGQVYRARLHSGEEVAVKVQRPNLEAIIKGDVSILKRVANFAERFPQLNENADWTGMLREFDVTVHEEMDYAAVRLYTARSFECVTFGFCVEISLFIIPVRVFPTRKISRHLQIESDDVRLMPHHVLDAVLAVVRRGHDFDARVGLQHPRDRHAVVRRVINH